MNTGFLRLRGAVALGMVIFVVFMLATGGILWIAQQGGVIPESLWSFASRAHPVGGIAFFLLGIAHVSLNRQLLTHDLSVLFGKKR